MPGYTYDTLITEGCSAQSDNYETALRPTSTVSARLNLCCFNDDRKLTNSLIRLL